MNTFKEFHPLVNFFWFLFVLGFSMFIINPVMIFISILCAFFYSVFMGGAKSIEFNTSVILPLALLSALINVMFNHSGATILFYLYSGNPVTLESIVYGFAAAGVIAQTVLWFSQFNFVMSDDKFVYLFGKISPYLALALSMTLRFVPNYKRKLHEILSAKKALGATEKNTNKVISAINAMSVMITWAFESSFDMADSMKSRGYGLKSRTAYSTFIFTKRDFFTLFVIILLGLYIGLGTFLGKMKFAYFPYVSEIDFSLYSISIYVAYAFLCLMPIFLEISEVIKWNALKQKI